MKNAILAVLLFSLMAMPSAFAQHSVSLASQPSPTAGVSAYNVYRAPCTTVAGTLCTVGEGTFAKLGTATIGATITYTDTTPLGGNNYSYYLTAVCPAAGCGTDASGNKIQGESLASNHTAAVIPGTLPLPPGNLSITNIARNTVNGNTNVSASWQDLPRSPTTYTFYGNGSVLSKGTMTTDSGNYTAMWTGKLKPGAAVSFEVCDLAGACSSKLL